MKLKGSTKIELTDVHTGKKEIYRDTNMVTKAVSQVFGNNIEGMLFCVAGSSTVSWSDYFLPICPNAIGGILLFQDAITEDAQDIAAYEERIGEPVVSFSEMVKRLKLDGRI